ncbi:hypothetical protein GCM10022240_24120 [Microbacterium kribbense]|uniref:Cell wall protein n=2 Tax=Microbacterium kribbense TaxID=433645 RepID=A0ABP7GPG9_9MICO
MFRALTVAVSVTALIAFGGAAAAYAQDDSGSSGAISPVASQNNYTPHTPTVPSLAGSTALAECVGDVPWIVYSVTLTDPDNQSTGHTAKLVLTDGSQSHTITLGKLVNNKLSGRVLWPGASLDSSGDPNGWPGWEYRNGQWVQTSGNFAWTRGHITATIEVNPHITVALSYPPATAVCASPTIAHAASTDGTSADPILAVTGLNVPVIPIGIGGGVIILLGAVLLTARRLRRH